MPSIKASENDSRSEKCVNVVLWKGIEMKGGEEEGPCGCHITFALMSSGIGEPASS